MGKGRILRLLRWVLPSLAAIFAVATPSAPVAARVSVRLGRTSTAVAERNSTFIRLSLSVQSEPLKFHARKGVIDVLAFDVDHDGYTDVVTVRRNSRVHVWLNDGHGGFVRRSEKGWRAAAGNRVRSGEPLPKGGCCGPPCNDDALSPLPATPVFGAGLLPSGINRPSAGGRFPADPFFSLRFTRGPPESIA
jgi:hypothetical protein